MEQYSNTWEQILTRGHYNEDNRELFDVPSYVKNILGEKWTKIYSYLSIYKSKKRCFIKLYIFYYDEKRK